MRATTLRSMGVALALTFATLLCTPSARATDPAQGVGIRHSSSGNPAWTLERISPPLSRLHQAVQVVYAAAQHAHVPEGVRISRIHVQRQHAGGAKVQSRVCVSESTRCIMIAGNGAMSGALEGLPAAQPLILEHTVTSWQDSPQPLYVRASVTVWFTLPATPDAESLRTDRQSR